MDRPAANGWTRGTLSSRPQSIKQATDSRLQPPRKRLSTLIRTTKSGEVNKCGHKTVTKASMPTASGTFRSVRSFMARRRGACRSDVTGKLSREIFPISFCILLWPRNASRIQLVRPRPQLSFERYSDNRSPQPAARQSRAQGRT